MFLRGDDMPRPGEKLQRIVKAIEAAINIDQRISVESPKFLKDMDTGRMREHDVVLTIKQKHHTILIALECKATAKKVGSPEVEAFHAKCQRTGINRGIIVSSRGFSKPGRKKAEASGIECFTLEDAIGFDWCIASSITFRRREVRAVNVISDPGPTPILEATLHTETGVPVDSKMLTNIGANCLKQLPELLATGEVSEEPIGETIVARFADNNPKFHLVDKRGNSHSLISIVVMVEYIVLEDLVPLTFHTYDTADKNSGRYSIASAKLQFEEYSGRLMLVSEAGKGTRIVFVPENAAATGASAGPPCDPED